MARITALGGIFFKTKSPDETKEWYKNNLGLDSDEYGTTFEWIQAESGKKGFTQWSPMKDTTDYFEPSSKEFMINYRVDNIEEMVEQLEANGINVIDEIEEFEYGKFVHLIDPDGNNIELWEPVDDEYDKVVNSRTK